MSPVVAQWSGGLGDGPGWRQQRRSVVVKRELSSLRRSSPFHPTLTYGHELWAESKRTRWKIQAAEMSFLHREAELSLLRLDEELGHPGGILNRPAEKPAELVWPPG